MIYISVMLTAAVVLLALLVWRLRRLEEAERATATEIRELRLTSRARVAQASVQSGAVSDEQVLSRLGRASTARRVVFGGDDDSPQKQDLVRQTTINSTLTGGEDDE